MARTDGAADCASGNGNVDLILPEVPTIDQPVCLNDLCSCQPDCSGKECGPDGCGGSCGTCAAGFQCSSGHCKKGVCAPAWSDGFEDPEAFALLWVADWHSKFVSKKIVHEKCFAGNACLYVEGKLGQCWAGGYHRSLGIIPPLRISLALWHGSETLTGCHHCFNEVRLQASVGPWDDLGVQLLSLCDDGYIGGRGRTLGSHIPEHWYQVDILVVPDEDNQNKLIVSYQLNGGELVSGSIELPTGMVAADLSLLSLSSADGSSLYDEVVVEKCE